MKTFVGIGENSVKLQVYIALIANLLLELIRRTIAKKNTCFSNFVEKIKMNLCFYLSLNYVWNPMSEVANNASQVKQMKTPLSLEFFLRTNKYHSMNKEIQLFFA